MPDGSRALFPRPQLLRKHWSFLEGDCRFALGVDATRQKPNEVQWSGTIRVPLAPETCASGIHETEFDKACWYQKTINSESFPAGDRLMLHFGAVDNEATVWANGSLVASHCGGYTPFFADRTPKIPFVDTARATRGPVSEQDQIAETIWREQLMQGRRLLPLNLRFGNDQ